MALVTIRPADEQPGARAVESAVYTLPDGSRVRIRAGGLIPEGAVPDVAPVVTERAKPVTKRQTKARDKAPENR